MDAELYRDAKEGNVLRTRKHLTSTQLTPNGNTPLHVVVQFNDSSKCVEEILNANRSLLHQVNSVGDTALHVAARNGRSAAGLALMVTCAERIEEDLESGSGEVRKFLTARNRNGDTALHEAIRSDHPEMVKMMLLKEPEMANIVNNSLESPLFVAVDRRRSLCLDILDCWPSASAAAAYSGPKGRTALHAAAVHDFGETVKALLKKYPIIIKEVDDLGWTALHYAARYGSGKTAEALLDADRSIAYIAAENDNNHTALHLATCWGNVQVIRSILNYCPDSWEMVTVDGRNILHLAVDSHQQRAMEFILEQSWVGDLINQKDVEGNTPLHLYATAPHFEGDKLVSHQLADVNATNKKHMTPLDVMVHDDKFHRQQIFLKMTLDKKSARIGPWSPINCHMRPCMERCDFTAKKKMPLNIKETGGTHMVVATLIMTVALAAGFTIPGGYNGSDGPSQGLAILTRETAFKAFVITDALAMICSASAVSIHFLAATLTKREKLMQCYGYAAALVMVGLLSMVTAFMTGLYAVLKHSMPLAIAECVICSIWFPIFCCTFKAIKS